MDRDLPYGVPLRLGAFGTLAFAVAEVGKAALSANAATALPAVLLLAALWELTSWKWRAVRSYHLIAPLPPRLAVPIAAILAGAALISVAG